MPGIALHPDDLPWETWTDPDLAARSPVRWKLLVSRPRADTNAMCCGIAEIPPGAELVRHRHAPAEIYHVTGGEGVVEVDGVEHRVRVGSTVFIPSDAPHRAACSGTLPLSFLFVFPTASFDEVVYRFDDGEG